MVLKHELLDTPQVMGGYTVIAGQPNTRLQPELAFAVRRTHVHMRRLTPLVGVDMIPKRANPQNRRRGRILSPASVSAMTFRPKLKRGTGPIAAVPAGPPSLQPTDIYPIGGGSTI